ncbi:hypothetical protein LJB99_06965, partial [Deltaproteobacteria bacterium OttesenSCG-928-K17]|nr:hypothetical protein [Deltaproteobacteria bacterium OttesenSCG-928-K17]
MATDKKGSSPKNIRKTSASKSAIKAACRQMVNYDQHKDAAPDLDKTVKKLLRARKKLAAFEHVSQVPTPSFKSAKEIVNLALSLLFPGFFSQRPVTEMNIEYHTGQLLYAFYEK